MTASTVASEELDRLVGGAHHNPHAVLGAHPTADGTTTIRTLRPEATSVSVDPGRERARRCSRVHDGGIFEVVIDGPPRDYRLEVTYGDHTLHRRRSVPLAADARRGRPAPDRRGPAREPLGGARRARPHATTRPAARSPAPRSRCGRRTRRGVRVVGDFDYWDGRALPMRSLGSSRRLGALRARRRRRRAGTSSRSWARTACGGRRPTRWPSPPRCRRPPRRWSTRRAYEWDDDAVAAAAGVDRVAQGADVDLRGAPRLVAAGPLLPRARRRAGRLPAPTTGFTHVEFLPVAEHPFGGSWGYQVTSYYAPVARFGSPDDFRYLVDALHQAGIGVIVDWVPAHFPKDDFALGRFDGTALYEHGDPRRGEQPDWGTFVFNFGRSRGAQLPGRQRAVLARGVPRRRAAGRRRRLDALPRLLAPGRRVDAQQVRRPGEPRGGRLPAGDERDRLQARARRGDDRRGVDVLAGCHPADAPGRARLRLQVEHGLDARHARLHRARSRSTGSTTTTS